MWRPLDTLSREPCRLAASTVHRWLDGAGKRAVESVPEQLAGIGETQELGHGWAVGQAERASGAGGAAGGRQRQRLDLPASRGTG